MIKIKSVLNELQLQIKAEIALYVFWPLNTTKIVAIVKFTKNNEILHITLIKQRFSYSSQC